MPWIMYQDPPLKKAPVEKEFPPQLVDRWLQALERPEREMKRRAAMAIVRAVSKDVPGLEVTIEPLCNVLSDPEQDRIVRLSVARALVALDARQATPVLIPAADPRDLEMAEIVEPAMARWGDASLRDRWMDRLKGEVGLQRLHVLALRGLTSLGEETALPRMLELAADRHCPVMVRLEAAESLGCMQDSGLLDVARRFSQHRSSDAIVDRLIAAKMLSSHRGVGAEKLLIELATDHQPSVAVIALRNLFRIDPGLILPIIDDIVKSEDSAVRRWGAEVLIASATPRLIGILGSMLDDPDPQLRQFICDSLVQLAEVPDLRSAVLQHGRRVLNEDSWRGQEQATLLLVTLEDTTITDRLVELLDVSRQEANVAAAWGLCELALPSSADPVYAVVQRKTESWFAKEPQNDGLNNQLALLFQLLGVLRYSQADSLLRRYIPLDSGPGDECRAAAIWTLGHLHETQTDEQLARQFDGRIRDAFSDVNPENWLVSRMAAIAVGRMKAENSLPGLRNALSGATLQSGLGYGCAWAIWQITGEEIPTLEPIVERDANWFLIPTSLPRPKDGYRPVRLGSTGSWARW